MTTLIGQLNTLESSNLIQLVQAQPELEYLFRHALIQDAAYASLVKPDRKLLHRIVGEALERMYPDRREELSGLLAHHFIAAGELDKAIAYSRQAARRAETMYAYEGAAQHLRTALDLIGQGERVETRLALLEQLADIHRLLQEGAQAIAVYRQALDAWRGQPSVDRMIELRLHRKIVETANNMKWRAGFEQVEAVARLVGESRANLESALRRMEGEPPHAETVRLLTALSEHAWRIEDPANWDAAEHYARAAVAMGEQLDDPLDLSSALNALAGVHLGRGLLREQVDVALRRLELARDLRFGDLRKQVTTLNLVGGALTIVGEYALAMPYLLEAESLGDHIRAVDLQVQSLSFQSQCWFRLDRWDEMFAIEDKRRDLEQRYPRERVGATCFEIALGATVHSLRGELERARAPRQKAYDIMAGFSGPPEKWWRNQHY